MMQHLNPDPGPRPSPLFSQGVLVPPHARWLYISGQVSAAEGIERQVEEVWANVVAVLNAAAMTVNDLVKLTAYVVDRDALPVYSALRARQLGSARPASTVVIVAGLARPELKFEVEAVAAAVP